MPAREACRLTVGYSNWVSCGRCSHLVCHLVPEEVEESNWTQLRALGDTSFGTGFGGKDRK